MTRGGEKGFPVMSHIPTSCVACQRQLNPYLHLYALFRVLITAVYKKTTNLKLHFFSNHPALDKLNKETVEEAKENRK